MDTPTAEASAVRVNKRELAKLLDCSQPTLDKMIDDNADFPIEQRGSNGVEWQFDPAKVHAWREAKRLALITAGQARAEAMGALGFKTDADRKLAELTPHEQLALAKVEEKRRQMAREAGLLMDVATLRARQAPIVQTLAAKLNALPERFGRKHNLPPAMLEDLRVMIESDLEVFAQDMDAGAAPEPEETDDLLARA